MHNNLSLQELDQIIFTLLHQSKSQNEEEKEDPLVYYSEIFIVSKELKRTTSDYIFCK